jgi:hypothetical protein
MVRCVAHPENDKSLSFAIKNYEELRGALSQICDEAEKGILAKDEVRITFSRTGHIDVYIEEHPKS